MKSLNEAKYGFWGALARKAKSFLDEDGSPGESPGQYDAPMRQGPSRDGASVGVQVGSAILLPLPSSLIELLRIKLNHVCGTNVKSFNMCTDGFLTQ